ncbi:disease resistance protein RPP13-like [Nicotiana tomentosiformis]|uniref:disease resistance protein RPP13-like n=1 Tax=Nicotiana tomentosiformis TaxID=4098 RepID=UPI001445DE85|nr:disease resistance protein RPP13-like [Nicotiana tomentosiformis]
MRLLTFDECWNLLYHKVFENECLTPEFEKIGKEIARKCQGLPLATVVMAGVLLKIGKSLDEWTKVVEDVNLLMSTYLDQYCSRVLVLSYYHLPHHLTACLLYLVVFKKSSEIQVSKLVRLWTAEGFVKVKRDESFEMVVEKYLKDLVDRSLIIVNMLSFFGKIISCGLHDMVHGFCSEEAQNTNFLNIITENDVQHQGSRSSILFPSHQRRVSIQSSGMNYQLPLGDDTDTEVRSILYCGNSFCTIKLDFSRFKLLRVLDISSVTLDSRPNIIEGLFHLRYLAFTIYQPSNTPVYSRICRV